MYPPDISIHFDKKNLQRQSLIEFPSRRPYICFGKCHSDCPQLSTAT